ncbi:HMG-box, partial [Lichtheimia hyalospora FSU 10163]
KKRKPRASDMPKLPKSAYLFYSMAHRAQAREQTGGGQAKDVMKLLARMWRSLDEKDKHPYYLRAMEEKKRYNREMRLY